ncbi:hypothetical protein [Bacillus alkalicola]|uniref:Uncharacterized protein n=1 Tax=Evansella alkalicola TaxID=745819 RepID=A0ABS6JYS7_9BACI|nr:hypothetical protein [Bacillus alkalicola]MBU9722250.1 hypothetical protein [Bacillus alkalicola]
MSGQKAKEKQLKCPQMHCLRTKGKGKEVKMSADAVGADKRQMKSR